MACIHNNGFGTRYHYCSGYILLDTKDLSIPSAVQVADLGCLVCCKINSQLKAWPCTASALGKPQ